MIFDFRFIKTITIKITIILGLFLFAKPVCAAEFFATVSNPVIELGEFTQVNFFLDTQTQELNALETYIVYPPNLLEVKEITYGNSVINYWVEKPHNSESGKIFLSGITPGGFNENFAPLLSVIFQTKSLGKAEINFEKNKALQNNGYGTPVKSSAKYLFLNIQPNLQKKITKNAYKILDQTPPETFEPFILEDSNIFSGKKVLIFDTLDKNSGIAWYEILEEKIINIFGWKFKTGNWSKTQSPYLLKDQKLKSNIYVKATDKAGNYFTASILKAKNPSWYTDFNFWVIILIILLLLYLSWGIYEHYHQKNKHH